MIDTPFRVHRLSPSACCASPLQQWRLARRRQTRRARPRRAGAAGASPLRAAPCKAKAFALFSCDTQVLQLLEFRIFHHARGGGGGGVALAGGDPDRRPQGEGDLGFARPKLPLPRLNSVSRARAAVVLSVPQGGAGFGF